MAQPFNYNYSVQRLVSGWASVARLFNSARSATPLARRWTLSLQSESQPTHAKSARQGLDAVVALGPGRLCYHPRSARPGSSGSEDVMTTGYSDRINHALAFAAKHHDQEVRKGTRLPYVTRPANVAIILARYDQDE